MSEESPTEAALISEYDERGLRIKVREIAGFDHQGSYSGMRNWWLLYDLHLLGLGREDLVPDRDYGAIL